MSLVIMMRTRLTAGGEPYPQVNETARSLAKAGHEVVLFGWDRTADCRYSSKTEWGWIERYPVTVPIDRTFGRNGFVGRIAGYYWWVRRRVYFLWKKKGYRDMIFHSHDLDTLPLGVLMSKALQMPLVYEAHENYGGMIQNAVGPDLANWVQKIELYLLRFCNGIIGSGPPVYAWLRMLLAIGYPPPGVPILAKYRLYKKLLMEPIPAHPTMKEVMLSFDVPEGLLQNDILTMISNAKRLEDYEGDYKVPSTIAGLEGLNILFIGVFVGGELKFLPQIITTLKNIRGVNLVIAGYGSQSNKIRKLAEQTDNVQFIGALTPEEIPRWTRACDATIRIDNPHNLNTRFSTSNIFFSSLAAGRPLICNEETISGKVVKDKRIGFALPIGDWKALRKTVKYMRDNPEEVKLRGRLARLLAEEKHRWDMNEERLLALYRNL